MDDGDRPSPSFVRNAKESSGGKKDEEDEEEKGHRDRAHNLREYFKNLKVLSILKVWNRK